MLFDIQRFSTHDGNGIRTVVFLKGCPLSCAWCENPESQAEGRELLHDPSRCIGCLSCLSAECLGVMRLTSSGIVPDRGMPVPEVMSGICPANALRVAGFEMDAKAIFNEVMKDDAFFRRSGGGVTFSGGEPLAQPGLLLECIGLFRAAEIKVAVETCLAVEPSVLELFLGLDIHWLLDVKQVDSGKFRLGTGGDAAVVLANIARAANRPETITFRIPLIPGFNDGEEDMRAILDFISFLSPEPAGGFIIDLLPFHDLAAGKFALLGRPDPYGKGIKLEPSTLERWRAAAAASGFTVSDGG